MSSPSTPRVDLYAGIHKALRLAMTDTLVRFGSLDASDALARREAIDQLGTLLAMCRSHVDKENRYVHPAVDACCPGTTHTIAAEHVEHLVALAALEAELADFARRPDAAALFALYRHLARFVAENLAHMDYEEEVHNAALWRSYDDVDLMRIHGAIVDSIAPEAMAQILHWMLPAMNHDERAGMLLQMRATAPAPAFEATLQLARARLSQREWDKLDQALNPWAAAA